MVAPPGAVVGSLGLPRPENGEKIIILKAQGNTHQRQMLHKVKKRRRDLVKYQRIFHLIDYYMYKNHRIPIVHVFEMGT